MAHDFDVEVGTGVGEFVRLETKDSIGVIRLERPPMNALNSQVQEELRAAASAVAAVASVRAVIVYGGETVSYTHLTLPTILRV